MLIDPVTILWLDCYRKEVVQDKFSKRRGISRIYNFTYYPHSSLMEKKNYA